MTLKLVTEPTIEPISLVQAKLHLKVDDSTDDSLITSLIVAAREYCEGYQNRAYCQQTWDMWLDSMPYRDIRIPLPPLQSVTSVKHYDANDMEYTLASTEYLVDDKSEPGRIVLVSNNWATSITICKWRSYSFYCWIWGRWHGRRAGLCHKGTTKSKASYAIANWSLVRTKASCK